MRWRDLIQRPGFKVLKFFVPIKDTGSKAEKRSWHGYGLVVGKPKGGRK